MITVTFPVEQERVKEETSRIRTEIDARMAEMKVLRSMLSALQDNCKHSGQRSYEDYGGGYSKTACTFCGSTE